MADKLSELVPIISDVFTLDDLEMLIRFEFSRQLAEFVDTQKALKFVAFDLAVAFDQTGGLDDLIRAVYRSRSRKDSVIAYCRKHAAYLLEDVDDRTAAGRAYLGLNALVVQAPEIPQDLSDDLKSACEGISRIDRYKRLHDRLHTMEFRLFRTLLRAAKAFRRTPQGPDELFELNAVLGDFSIELAEATRISLELTPLERQRAAAWLQRLNLAMTQLRAVVDGGTGNPEMPVMVLIRPALQQFAAQINTWLFEEANRLPLGKVSAALSALTTTSPALSTPSIDQGLASLSRLNSRMQDLVSEHNQWQIVDNDLRLVSDSTEGPAGNQQMPDTLAMLFGLVEDNLRPLCVLRADSSWLVVLLAIINQVKTSLNLGTVDRFRMSFDDFQRQARQRFFQVDDELLQLCNQLVSMNGPLARLATQR